MDESREEEKVVLWNRVKKFLTAFGAVLAFFMLFALPAAWGTWIFPVLLALLAGAGALLFWTYYHIYLPYKDTLRKLGLFAARGRKDDLEQIHYYPNLQVKLAVERMQEYLTTSTTLELSKRQAQYQALQNQINPHFLYNTLESIRSEALLAGLTSVASMCEKLASFFRYTISNMENLVTVEEEIDNIITYFYIQQYRFGERLQLEIQCPEEDREAAMKCLIPKLTFQPVVENAIIHGIEQKIGQGRVLIYMMLTEKRLIIRISDDGIGMDQETLNRINSQMTERSVRGKSQGGIAIGNVHNRIKLLFGEAYGLTVFSTRGIGTDVEITLPRTTEQDRKKIEHRAEEMK